LFHIRKVNLSFSLNTSRESKWATTVACWFSAGVNRPKRHPYDKRSIKIKPTELTIKTRIKLTRCWA